MFPLGGREENRYPEESRFTQQHQHQADSKETDESPSNNGGSDGELSSKEKERSEISWFFYIDKLRFSHFVKLIYTIMEENIRIA